MALADQQTLTVQEITDRADFLALHRLNPDRYPFLLESRAQNEAARHDILFAFPQDRLTLTGDQHLHGPCADEDGFLFALDRWFEAESVVTRDHEELPFTGGWFLYLGYELAQEIEPVLSLPMPDARARVAEAVRIPLALIHDHQTQKSYLVAEPGYETAIKQVLEDIQQITAIEPQHVAYRLTEESPELYLQRVQRALQYIYDGDVFQANLSRPWSISLLAPACPADIYANLRVSNPGPYNGLAVWPDQAILSSSPELLMQVHDRQINTRPIAGTRPRGQSDQEDAALSNELLGHHKERAEHVMLIDLERNDLGRICVPGTVVVNELMVLESYAHVHHIVSNVQGTLRSEITPGDIVRALFPGGTITGCPKVRCMEIIAELEQQPRSAYTGSMGYLNRNGDMTLNILIRTLEQRGDQLVCRAGAGIVSDSDPQHELEETRAKARGMLLALENR